MAHLRPLGTDHCFGCSYAEGLSEYVEFAISPMREKEFQSNWRRRAGTAKEKSPPGGCEAMAAYA